tara:strand:+ start:1705 stop:1935 length:231 start_codon:yes stop_codon:yes gene_type:complete
MSYSLNGSQATGRRVVEKLQLSTTEVDDLLLTVEGRKTIGYNYLVSENPSEEIGYDKEGKNYNVSYGPNRAQRRGN